jgi:Fe-S cluster assembly protein SufD
MALFSDALRHSLPDPSPAERVLIDRFMASAADGRRTRAFEAFARTGLPHRRLEAWKWSDFRAALADLAPVETPAQGTPLPVGAGAVTLKFSGSDIQLPDKLPEGLRLHAKSDAQALGDAESVPMAALAAALARREAGPDTVILEAISPVSRPVHLIFEGGATDLNLARIAVIVRPEASLDLVESHLGGAALSSALIEIGVQSGGSVRRTLLQRGDDAEAQAVTAMVHLDRGARLVQTALAFGARVARIETRLTHQETGSAATLNSAYLCAAGQHVDFTSHVRHGAPSCKTRQVTKGAVMRGGRGVFQGKFLVPRHVGQHTDADMQHQALLLEQGAEVFAKPELEIYADDVECAHGNTSGALDPDQLFYLRQRGLPLTEARAMLTEAFIAEALELAGAGTHEALSAAAADFLSGAGA